MSDVIAVLIWWLLLQAMGWAALPLVFRLLRWLPDRGYSVAKPAGLLLGNYLLWLMGTLGWLRNTEGGILVAFALVAAFGVWVYRRWDDGSKLLDWIRAHMSWVVAYELVFLVALAVWAIFRAHNPDLSSTEKPMEFAFTNAIRRSASFPPHDPWLSGFAISYYYFGYIMMSTLTKLSGVASGVAFGLSNALWFALTAAGAFGIVANLVAVSKRATRAAIVGAGLIGVVFVPLLGNFEGPLEVAHVNGAGSTEFWRWLDILELNAPPIPNVDGEVRWPLCDANGCKSHPRGAWWFWRASRVVHDYRIGSDRSDPTEDQGLIDEFPFFSFLLGDMHPHVLALPYALMSLALALNVFRMSQAEDSASGAKMDWRRQFWSAAPIALMYPVFLGGLSFLNTWDFPIHVFIVALAWTLGRWLRARPRTPGAPESIESGNHANARPGSASIWSDGLIALVMCGFVGVVAYAPFYIGFRSQAGGLVPNVYNPTAVQQFFVMFGPFLLIGAAFLTTLMIRAVRQRRLSAAGVLLGIFGGGAGLVVSVGILTALASVAVVAVFSGVRQIVSDWTGVLESQGVSLGQVIIERLSNFGTPLLIGIGLAAIGLLARAMTGGASYAHDEESRLTREESAPFALMLLFVGALLTFAVEYVYLLDFFGTRMNTAFKLYYQTWALWGVASAYAVYYLLQSSERLRNVAGRAIFGIVLAICVAAGLIYPLFTIRDKVDLSRPPTLDARAPTREFSPDEVAAIDWLDRTAVGLPVILEAEGQEYRDYTSRLSAWTGLPSVLGWSGHEGQWRGNYQEAAPRQADIDKIYATNDPATASSLLRKYDVAYVYVGPNERQKYPVDGLAKFDKMLEVAFQQGNATIYRVRDGVEAREAVAK